MPAGRTPLGAVALALSLLLAPLARAAVLTGDLNGDGAVDASDQALFESLYASVAGDASYQTAADFNADGLIDLSDLGIFGASCGSTGGDLDATPPGLFVSLNDIPDDQNDLLVVPPDGFQITLDFDALGHSLIDPTTLSVTSSEDAGAFAAGTELAGQFTVMPERAVWDVPAGTDLARTAHFLTVSVRDLAGNEASDVYGFAVRDFEFGAPLGNLNRLFLDFDQDRAPAPNGTVDFLEDMREYGLSSVLASSSETAMQNLLVSEILGRVNQHYGHDADGSPGPDPVNIVFTAAPPIDPHARICIGGESPAGPLFLGATQLDVNNLNEFTDACILSGFGVFPQALDDLWGGNATYQAAFHPLDPGEGGTPYGEFPADVTGYDFSDPTHVDRFVTVINAANAFARAVGTATAHEVGHMLGLSAPGATPSGLYGGETGFEEDHNVEAGGGSPTDNYLMNQGSTFTFEEMTGLGGGSLPTFRPLSWAYLRDRIALNDSVTGLFPAPSITDIAPNPANYGGGVSLQITITGDNFVATPVVELYAPGSQVPNLVSSVVLVDPQTVTGILWSFLVFPGTYDVRFLNGDDQEIWWSQQLVVGP